MSIATRCPCCGTVFRVVSDQLKVSEGWVRCGRCSEVFNAGQRLFELDAAASASPSPPPPAPERPAAEVHRLPVRDAGATAAAVRVSAALAPAAEPAAEAVDAQPAEAVADAMARLPPHSAAEVEPEASGEPTLAPISDGAPTHGDDSPQATHTPAPDTPLPPSPAEPLGAAAAVTEPPLAEPAEAVPPEPTPEFVRRADRAARWRQPSRRAALSGTALLLLALLMAQIALHYRDHVAATWPGTQPWLQAACNLLGCRVEPPRRIDALNVDSSGLVRLQDSPLYRLSLVVQNRSATRVRMPAIDLALSDGQGQTTARRVLSAAELGHSADSLPAGGEVSLQATLDLGSRRVAGYTVELFYP
jgi:predicted Zn finger-like uncharacterized protein